MIYLYSALFGYVNIIAFQLTGRIAITEKSIKSVLGHCKNMLGFSYFAIPTRHEVRRLPYLHGILADIMRNKPTKLKIADMAKTRNLYIKLKIGDCCWSLYRR